MIALAVVLVIVTAVTYVLLRHADRWGHQPVHEPPSELVAQMRRMSDGLAKVGMSFNEMVPALQRAGDAIALVGETWVIGLHGQLPGTDVCRMDRGRWPCREHVRLTASIKARRERLRLTDPKLSDPATRV